MSQREDINLDIKKQVLFEQKLNNKILREQQGYLNKLKSDEILIIEAQYELLKKQNETLEKDNKTIKIQSWITTFINFGLLVIAILALALK